MTLEWPSGWKRTREADRQRGAFKKASRQETTREWSSSQNAYIERTQYIAPKTTERFAALSHARDAMLDGEEAAPRA